MTLQPICGAAPDTDTIEAEARRILRRLCEGDAQLVVAAHMHKAAVLRSGPDGEPMRIAVLERDVAQAFALRDWIVCLSKEKLARYRISHVGRAALKRLLAAQESATPHGRAGNVGDGFAEQHREWGPRSETAGDGPSPRCNLAESPLASLARRRDARTGQPFLSRSLVNAGERLREDFELAQMGPRVTQNWDRFLTGGDGDLGRPREPGGSGSSSARQRVSAALGALGPGLGDILLRCCCFLEGLEAAEKRMGWSARSGKIVLRIALQQLANHYDAGDTAREPRKIS